MMGRDGNPLQMITSCVFAIQELRKIALQGHTGLSMQQLYSMTLLSL